MEGKIQEEEEEKKNHQQQNLEEEYTCPLCLELIVEPLTTTCNHSFCELCIEEMLDIQDKVICPLDRKKQKKSDFKPNPDLRFKIQELFPEKYRERMEFYQKQKQIRDQLKKITILYGNHHEMIVGDANSQNTHRWTVFTEIENEHTSKYIDSVTYELHPTFNPPRQKINQSPFQLTRVGWGTFEIDITIKFKGKIYNKSDSLELTHLLVFRNNGKTSKYSIKVDLNNLN